MFELLTARLGRQAEAAAAARLGLIAAHAAEAPPEGVRVSQGGGVVILTGPQLRVRLLADAAFRGWVREWAR